MNRNIERVFKPLAGFAILAFLAGCIDATTDRPAAQPVPHPTISAAAIAPATPGSPTAPPAVVATPRAPASPEPAIAPGAAEPVDAFWADVERILERQGEVNGDVCTFTIVRDDLDVAIDGTKVPTGAGLRSVFHFFRSTCCGKVSVVGEFVCADYEADDVVDALRQGAVCHIASVAPMFQYDQPRVMIVRFQAEGDPLVMAKAVREAIRWTGKERMAPEPAGASATEPSTGLKASPK